AESVGTPAASIGTPPGNTAPGGPDPREHHAGRRRPGQAGRGLVARRGRRGARCYGRAAVAPHRRIVVAAGAALALLVAYLVLWVGVSRHDIGRSDFTASYVAGTLLREGHRGDIYDESVQQPLHARLIAPDREGNLPFVNPPPAAALAAPVTALGLDAAYRLWSLLQLGLLAAAVAVAIRSAPRPSRRWDRAL